MKQIGTKGIEACTLCPKSINEQFNKHILTKLKPSV